MTSQPLVSFGRWSALISFIIGTLIFLCFCITRYTDVAIAGYFYMIIAGIFNAIILLLIVIEAVFNNKLRHELIISAACLLLNIPAAFAYTVIGISMIDSYN